MNETSTYKGTFTNNRIVYIDNNIKNIIDISSKKYIRENKEENYILEFDFINNVCKVYINGNDNYMLRDIAVTKCEFLENKVNIAYYFLEDEENKIEYLLEYSII